MESNYYGTKQRTAMPLMLRRNYSPTFEQNRLRQGEFYFVELSYLPDSGQTRTAPMFHLLPSLGQR